MELSNLLAEAQVEPLDSQLVLLRADCAGVRVDRPVARDVVQRAGKQPHHSIVANPRVARVAEHVLLTDDEQFHGR